MFFRGVGLVSESGPKGSRAYTYFSGVGGARVTRSQSRTQCTVWREKNPQNLNINEKFLMRCSESHISLTFQLYITVL